MTQVVGDSSETTTATGITGSAKVSADTTLPPSAKVGIENKYTAGTPLPSTGGSGTLIYTIVGAFLIAVAGVLLVSRRKRKT